MNIVMCQKQAKNILMIHSCVFEVAKICVLRKINPKMWGNIFLGNLTYNEICFPEKCHSRKVSPWGIVSPICFFRNSTPCILKGGPHTMLAQRFLF
jgi:hypothetical protein